uniref:Putative secreted protein n=1 Tax=Anopheles marajoara TaxID=58244 RepID=A0A2M4CFU5_9DIPT
MQHWILEVYVVLCVPSRSLSDALSTCLVQGSPQRRGVVCCGQILYRVIACLPEKTRSAQQEASYRV